MEVLLTQPNTERGLHQDLAHQIQVSREVLEMHLKYLGLADQDVLDTMALVDTLVGAEVEAEAWAN